LHVSDEGYSGNASCELNLISTFLSQVDRKKQQYKDKCNIKQTNGCSSGKIKKTTKKQPTRFLTGESKSAMVICI
jgi:hypothetical protein